MTIEEYDFKLEPLDATCTHFDLYFRKVINKGKVNERVDWSKPYYGVHLDGAIRMIVNHRIHTKHESDALSLKEYFKEFNNSWNEVYNLCKVKKPSPDKN